MTNKYYYYYHTYTAATVTEFNPKNRLTIKPFVTMEWGMKIPVLTKILSTLGDPEERMTDTTGFIYKYWYGVGRNSGTISDVIECIIRWISSTSTDSVPEPTWSNFFKILKDTSPELGHLAYQIKEVFQGILYNVMYNVLVL